MGRVRPQMVKRMSKKLMVENEDAFTLDFNENKKKVDGFVDLNSKFMRNRIAGYITKLERRRRS